MNDAFKKPLFSQRRELARVAWWLRSERFKGDLTEDTVRAVAESIAEMLESEMYEDETACTRGDDGVDLGPRPSPSVNTDSDSSAPATPSNGDVLTSYSGERGDTRIVATATAAQGPGSGDGGERPALCKHDGIGDPGCFVCDPRMPKLRQRTSEAVPCRWCKGTGWATSYGGYGLMNCPEGCALPSDAHRTNEAWACVHGVEMPHASKLCPHCVRFVWEEQRSEPARVSDERIEAALRIFGLVDESARGALHHTVRLLLNEAAMPTGCEGT